MKMELVVFCKPCLKQLQDWAWGLNERALLQLAAPSGSRVPWRQASPSWELSPWRQGFERPWWVAILTKATAANALGVASVSLLRGVPSAGSTVKYGKGRFACYWPGSRRRNFQGNIAKETGGHWDQVVHTVSYMLIFTGTCCWSSPPRTRSAQAKAKDLLALTCMGLSCIGHCLS